MTIRDWFYVYRDISDKSAYNIDVSGIGFFYTKSTISEY